MPRLMVYGIWVLSIAALLPPLLIAKSRLTTATAPRIHPIQDMDNQPRINTQMGSELFADGRGARPDIAETIAREHDWKLLADDTADYYLGVVVDENGIVFDDEHVDEAGRVLPVFVSAFPDEIVAYARSLETANMSGWERYIRHGQSRFEIFCAPCHGLDGRGQGRVAQRVAELAAGAGVPTWTPPSDLTEHHSRDHPVGQLYNVVRNGVRSMRGYGTQIPHHEDRWAIVVYLRALQAAAGIDLASLSDADRAEVESQLGGGAVAGPE